MQLLFKAYIFLFVDCVLQLPSRKSSIAKLSGKLKYISGLQVRRRKGKIHMAAEGAQTLLEICKSIVGSEVDLSSWEEKIQEEMKGDAEEVEKIEVAKVVEQKTVDTGFFQHEKFKNGVLTIGKYQSCLISD